MDGEAQGTHPDTRTHSAAGTPDFRALFESTPNSYLVCASDAPRFTIVAVSDAYLPVAMTTRAATIGRGLFEVFPEANPGHAAPSGEKNVRASLETVLRTRAPHRMAVQRYDLQRPDGTWEERHWRPLNVPVLGAGGEVSYILHHVEDVTSEVLRGEALARAERSAERILERVADAHVTLDRELRYVAANAAAERALGRPRRELVGRTYGEAFPAAADTDAGRAYRRVVAEGVEQHLTQHDVGDGHDRHLEIDAYPTDEGGVAVFWRDVTDRVRAEVALKASEERLRLAVAATGLGVFDWDLTTDRVTVNARFRELLGLPGGDEVIGAAMLGGVVHPDDRPFVEARLGAAFDPRSSGGYQFEHRAIALTGEERWLLTFGQVHFAGEGAERRAVRVIGNDLDITERKRAESERERLLATSEAARAALETANAELQDQALELELANQQLQDNAAELEVQAEELQAAAAEREQLLADLQRANAELRGVTAAAQAEGRRARFLADLGHALQPVTEPDAVMETAARLLGEHLGVDRCAYAEVEADEDTFTITGNYTRGDTIGILGRFTFRAFGAEVLRLMRANEAYVVDDAAADPRVTPPDRAAYEQTQIAAVVCVPLHKAGRFAAAMAVHQRVPRRWTPDEVELVVTVVQRCWESLERARTLRRLRESEAALRAASSELAERTVAAEAAQRAAEAGNQAKAEFLAVMSHELRTPLNAIAGYAELLEIGIHGPMTDQQREAISRIQRSQRHLLGLINDVLNFAKLEAGRVEYHVADVAVSDAVEAIEPLVAPQLRAKALRYDRSQCSLQRCVVRADPEKLQQILLNLLSNAVKFTAAGGAVTLRCEDRGAVVAVAVADTGIGIAADRLEHVFAPFVQLDRRLNAPHEGTGLGLAISRDLARGMGGDLAGESTPGVGSTFTLTLPRA